MERLTDRRNRILHRSDGASMVEYGLVLALVAIICIAVVSLIGIRTNSMFGPVPNSLGNAGSAGSGHSGSGEGEGHGSWSGGDSSDRSGTSPSGGGREGDGAMAPIHSPTGLSPTVSILLVERDTRTRGLASSPRGWPSSRGTTRWGMGPPTGRSLARVLVNVVDGSLRDAPPTPVIAT